MRRGRVAKSFTGGTFLGGVRRRPGDAIGIGDAGFRPSAVGSGRGHRRRRGRLSGRRPAGQLMLRSRGGAFYADAAGLRHRAADQGAGHPRTPFVRSAWPGTSRSASSIRTPGRGLSSGGAAHGPTRPTDSTGCSLICCSGCLILVGTRRRPERLRAATTPGQYPERRPLRIGCSGSPHTSYAGRRVYVCWLPGYSGLSFVGFDLFPRRRRRTTWRVACSARTSTMVRVRDVTTTSATCLSVIVLGRSFVPSGPALPSYRKCARLAPDFS